ncbi:response regulator [Psychrobacter alimentarius]|uniref:hypothetical protein n=1 Tax=Psychrobacter alimentarius TaxID=261164 RepID=UPI002A0A7876|nr:hypothetical protein [Psychrobacter alimentarius]
MLRQGLSDLLSLKNSVEVVGEASDEWQGLDFLAANQVELVVLAPKRAGSHSNDRRRFE